jgi:hypothetical protein
VLRKWLGLEPGAVLSCRGELPPYLCRASIPHAEAHPSPQSVTAPCPETRLSARSSKERTAARKPAAEYFEHFPKDRYRTEIESWRELQSPNIEFTMKRLREPIEDGG